MHTQCPHCATLFKISEEQLSAVNGKVRCGFCYRIFIAEESLLDGLPNMDSEGNALPEKIHDTADSKTSDISVPAIVETLHTTQNELQEEARKHLDEQSKKGKASAFTDFFWAFGVLVFTAVFILQYSYFMRDDLAKYASIRPALQQFCHVANCIIPLQRSPAQIKLISREISAHPSIKNALRVRATFINKAPYEQSYPTLKLTLSDLEGKTVAVRHFNPQEYLPQHTVIAVGIAAQQLTEIQLDIRDSNKHSTGFELAFL
ncbi:hypothetical protein MNBD_GAMMA16-351 [hydrothermal vent metagenome]|uniref:Zinc finger/thioredoxin putative domain-containing protein n=1 Tax=hydrothermal vent metagenome TaxID=652676 RepID=A0A3B0Z011_9ZZZZ